MAKQTCESADTGWLVAHKASLKETRGGDKESKQGNEKFKHKPRKSYRKKSAKKAAKVDILITDWTKGSHIYMDLKKAGGIFRLLWENFNSLQILTDPCVLQKMRSLDKHHKRLSANMIAGCETQTNWYQVPTGQRFGELVGLGEHTRCKAAQKIHNKTRYQPGGTIIATFGRTSGHNMEMNKDETRLTRWVWTIFDTGTTRQWFVTAYCPCLPLSSKKCDIDLDKSKIVYEQQYRYYQKKGYANQDPIYNFDKKLLAILSLWRM